MATASELALIANPTMKADDRSGAFGDGTANTTHLGKFTIEAGSNVHVLPSVCYGRFVRMYGTVEFEYFFTNASGATIAASGAATDAGLRAATQGELVPATTYHEVCVPWAKTGESIYLARIRTGGSDGALHVVLADGTRGVTDGG
jgi:hypothetical protein